MTDNSERFCEEPEMMPAPVVRSNAAEYGQSDPARTTTSGAPQSDMASLVLLINTVLGGLGTLYVTTRSAAVTFVAALQVLLMVVVLVVRRRGEHRSTRPGRKGHRGGW